MSCSITTTTCLPMLLTGAKRSDVKLADSFSLNPVSIVTVDRGYTDYALFGRWTLAGVFFVTLLKGRAPRRITLAIEK